MHRTDLTKSYHGKDLGIYFAFLFALFTLLYDPSNAFSLKPCECGNGDYRIKPGPDGCTVISWCRVNSGGPLLCDPNYESVTTLNSNTGIMTTRAGHLTSIWGPWKKVCGTAAETGRSSLRTSTRKPFLLTDPESHYQVESCPRMHFGEPFRSDLPALEETESWGFPGSSEQLQQYILDYDKDAFIGSDRDNHSDNDE